MPPKNVKRNFSNRDRSGDAKRSRSGYHAKEHDKCEWCGFSFARVDRHRLHCTQRPAGFAQAARSGAPKPVPGTSASAGTLPLSHANVLGLPVVLEEEDGVEQHVEVGGDVEEAGSEHGDEDGIADFCVGGADFASALVSDPRRVPGDEGALADPVADHIALLHGDFVPSFSDSDVDSDMDSDNEEGSSCAGGPDSDSDPEDLVGGSSSPLAGGGGGSGAGADPCPASPHAVRRSKRTNKGQHTGARFVEPDGAQAQARAPLPPRVIHPPVRFGYNSDDEASDSSEDDSTGMSGGAGGLVQCKPRRGPPTRHELGLPRFAEALDAQVMAAGLTGDDADPMMRPRVVRDPSKTKSAIVHELSSIRKVDAGAGAGPSAGTDSVWPVLVSKGDQPPRFCPIGEVEVVSRRLKGQACRLTGLRQGPLPLVDTAFGAGGSAREVRVPGAALRGAATGRPLHRAGPQGHPYLPGCVRCNPWLPGGCRPARDRNNQ